MARRRREGELGGAHNRKSLKGPTMKELRRREWRRRVAQLVRQMVVQRRV